MMNNDTQIGIDLWIERYEARLLNILSDTAREKYGDTAVEALVGALSSLVTTSQLETLIRSWGGVVR
jgi:hypothetical protein